MNVNRKRVKDNKEKEDQVFVEYHKEVINWII